MPYIGEVGCGFDYGLCLLNGYVKTILSLQPVAWMQAIFGKLTFLESEVWYFSVNFVKFGIAGYYIQTIRVISFFEIEWITTTVFRRFLCLFSTCCEPTSVIRNAMATK